jgi:hypothetical protein
MKEQNRLLLLILIMMVGGEIVNRIGLFDKDFYSVFHLLTYFALFAIYSTFKDENSVEGNNANFSFVFNLLYLAFREKMLSIDFLFGDLPISSFLTISISLW